MSDEEMVIICNAGGARPAATIEWSLSLTEEFAFEVEEEVNPLVSCLTNQIEYSKFDIL